MKKILQIFATIMCILFCTCASAQVLTVKFTGRDQTGQHYVKLDHVKTFNLDQLWEEVLYFPDTTLVLGGVGIIDYGNSASSQLEQNIPNPFDGTTNFTLYLREGADVLLEIFDLMGKSIVNQYYTNLSAGAHLFSANLTNPQVYILKVSVKNEQMHLKMVNKGYAAENSISYVSTSSQNGEFESGAKDSQALGIYPFQNGDELQHTGYTVINGVEYKSETITQRQNESETIILPFNLTPTVSTYEISNITSTSANCGGNVSYTGEAIIVNRGICWSTSNWPTINNNHTTDGSGTGSFTSSMTNLNPGTTYHVRAYATSSADITGYGGQVTFNTPATIPIVITSAVTNITDNSATCGGHITSDGGAAVTARGVCWSTNQNPTIADYHTTDGSGTGAFTSSITGLSPNTTYYVRAYATNSEGTSYGEQKMLHTLCNVVNISISGNTNINPGQSTTLTASGANTYQWSTNATTASITVSPTSNTAYTVVGTNNYGCTGSASVIVTINTAPAVTTHVISNIGTSAATCGGNVTSDGGATVTARGVCWSTAQNPTINNAHTTNGSGTGNFSSNITGLTPNTTYYVRAYATNSVGTSYGNQISFIPVSFICGSSTINDFDGNSYNTVSIGSQCWLKENLRSMHYANGTSIAIGTTTSTTTGYRYYPYNDSTIVYLYGYLYNWKATMWNSLSSNTNPSGVQGICPNGWHLPSRSEWSHLFNYVRSQSQYVCGVNDANTAKAYASTTGWHISSGECHVGNIPENNNATGFSVLPAGALCYSNYGTLVYSNYGERAYCWGTTEDEEDVDKAISFHLFYNLSYTGYMLSSKSTALSVRCLRDEENSSTILLPTVTTSAASNITETTAICGGNVTSDGGVAVTARGVCWSTSQNPTISDSHTTNGSGTGSFTSNLTGLTAGTTYYMRAYATNSAGTAYGNEVSFTTTGSTMQDGQPCPGEATVTDIDNNTYNTVQIGNQCWMKENLRTTRYADGTTIQLGTSTCTTMSYRYNPNNDASNVSTYGYLYNWAAVMNEASSSNSNPSGVQGICPNGWHVPSDAEWKQMESFLGISQSDINNSGWRGCIATTLSGDTGWQSSNIFNAAGNLNALEHNSSGFNALPAGSYNGFYNEFGNSAFFWAATEHDATFAFYRSIYYNDAGVYYNGCGKEVGFSVRCIRDEGISWDPQDGQPCPNMPNLTDIDGNVYNTVQIGQQCWMKENLRTTHYANNVTIPAGTTFSTITPYRYAPNNDVANVPDYGYLYNWPAVMHSASSSTANPSGVQGICPNGWHIPSLAEWEQLEEYVSSQSEFICGNNNTKIAKALSATFGWNSSPTPCAPGNNTETNNTTNFSALPAGSAFIEYSDIGNETNFWSTSDGYDCAFRYVIYRDWAQIGNGTSGLAEGLSVRCVKN